jgi:hypothetical protein
MFVKPDEYYASPAKSCSPLFNQFHKGGSYQFHWCPGKIKLYFTVLIRLLRRRQCQCERYKPAATPDSDNSSPTALNLFGSQFEMSQRSIPQNSAVKVLAFCHQACHPTDPLIMNANWSQPRQHYTQNRDQV